MAPKNVRQERDTMGVLEVPAEALWGAGTQRALLNFPISGLRLPRSFLQALGFIKLAAAQVNREDGLLPAGKARAIQRAAREVADGKHDDNFVVDVFQTGSGTSTNMNANEVIANRAAELIGAKRGDRAAVHPNDLVNMGQSSNDVIPTAIHVAAAVGLNRRLLPALQLLETTLLRKSVEFASVVKTGRTHLQDATPITLGQEFSGYAAQVSAARRSCTPALDGLYELAIGGTAVGTGINTRADFGGRVAKKLAERFQLPLRETSNHFRSQSSLDAVVAASSALKQTAVALIKIANDIRWMGSGPRAGLAELKLPEVQPGSSIMPGKVNPVIAESVCQVCAQVIGNDTTITIAGQSGNFELNVMMPVAAYNLLQSIEILAAVVGVFDRQCLAGISATSAGPDGIEQGLALATALVPHIGYDRSADVAKEAARSGRTVRQVAAQESGLETDKLAAILDPLSMTRPAAPVRRRRKKSGA